MQERFPCTQLQPRTRAASVVGFCALTFAAGAVLATGASDIVEVWPHERRVVIPFGSLALNQGQSPSTTATSEVATTPHHGSLTIEADHFLYQPDKDFWTLGTDSFVYSRQGPSDVDFGTVLLVAKLHGRRALYRDFEDGSTADLEPAYGAVVAEQWAIAGNSGCYLFLSSAVGLPLLEIAPSTQGGNSSNSGGSCVRVSLPPSANGGGSSPVFLPYPVTLFAPGTDGAGKNPAVELRAIVDPSGSNFLEATIWPDVGPPFQASTPLSEGEHLIHLDWWKKRLGGPDSGGLLVFLDGALVIDLSKDMLKVTIHNEQASFEGGDIFVLEAEPSQPLEVVLDDIEILHDDTADFTKGRSKSEVLLCDNFEGTGLEDWSNGATSQAVTASTSALSGKRGLEVDLTAGYPLFVIDNSPGAEAVYNTRFRLDTTDLELVDGDQLHIFSGSHLEDVPQGEIHLQLWLVHRAGGFEIQARHKELGGSSIRTDWIALLEGENVVELQWWAATRLKGANGGLRLWLNGTAVAELADLPNGDMVIESVRLGVKNPNPSSGSAGRFHFDDFQSWGGPTQN